MKDLYTQFREQAEHIKVAPAGGSWDRIEAKMQMQRSRRKLAIARLLSIAASLILVVTLSFIAIFYSQNQDWMTGKAYSMTIEELSTTHESGESMFDVEKIRKSYADLALTHN